MLTQRKPSNILNSLAYGRCGTDSVIFTLIMQNNHMGSHCEIVFKQMPPSFTNEK